MTRFPENFADLLSHRALATVDEIAQRRRDLRAEKLLWIPDVIQPEVARSCLELLDTHFGELLRVVKARIPQRSITGMRRNYADVLPKTLSNHSVLLNGPRAKATKTAEQLGLLAMLHSPSFRELVERLCGFKLEGDPGCQLIRYRPGDYIGPHNDHHPEAPNLRHGYIDFHLTLSSPGVEHQWLVFERQGFLSNMVDVAAPSGISVSMLPFWHYTTPLMAKPDREEEAERWLILASFSIQQGRRTRFARIDS